MQPFVFGRDEISEKMRCSVKAYCAALSIPDELVESLLVAYCLQYEAETLRSALFFDRQRPLVPLRLVALLHAEGGLRREPG